MRRGEVLLANNRHAAVWLAAAGESNVPEGQAPLDFSQKEGLRGFRQQ